ncbi:MAG: ATP-NAD kinase family protein [Candidatus Odinarchaeia archaeon]
MFRLGLIVNPIAGLGGLAGYKGTDDPSIVTNAIKMGIKPKAMDRVKEVFKELKPLKDLFYIYTAEGNMGEFIIKELGFSGEVIYNLKSKITTALDTKKCATILLEKNIDLLVFCGGDGTAVDIVEVIDEKIPILGVPAGVKMHSGVFATTPSAAALIIRQVIFGELPFTEKEVMDIDEKAFREGRLSAELKGYAKVPYQPMYVQGVKGTVPNRANEVQDKSAIARYIIDSMEKDVFYILAPGTTVAAIVTELSLDKTLLGVDIVKNKKLIAKDVNEKEILKIINDKPTKIVVTVIGNQGFIFGRGNQQISPRVIKKVGLENIIVIATPQKLSTLDTLRVDTGDKTLDARFKGYLKVITGYGEKELVKVTCI